MFKFYLNGTLVSNPTNWHEFEEVVERDSVIKGILPKYDIKLTFTGSGYSFLYNYFLENGYCGLVSLTITKKCAGSTTQILDGRIFISDIEFNLNKCTANCGVHDNNYGSRIYNNKSIETLIDTGKSKNGVTIDSAQSYDVFVFKPSDFSYFGATRKAYFLSDVFRFLVEFMTDGLVGFESTYLDYTLPLTPVINQVRSLVIMTGAELRVPGQVDSPLVSFATLFSEVNKKYPIAFTIIKGADGRPLVKIEQEDYFFGASSGLVIDNIEDLIQTQDKEMLYSRILFGGDAIDFDGSDYHFPQTRFFNFIREQYYLQGECNIDKTLDLTANFISDSNIIEGMVATDTSNDSYDDSIFLMEINYAGALQAFAYQDPITNTIPVYYNNYLLNNQVAERYSLASNVAFYLNDGDDNFRATKTTDTSFGTVSGTFVETSAIVFQNDSVPPNFDTSGNYNNATGEYLSSANGLYGFESRLRVRAFSSITATISFKVRFKVYDGGGSHVYTYDGAPISISVSSTLFGIIGNQTFYVPSGFKVKVHLVAFSSSAFTLSSLMVLTDSYYLTTSIENGGGVYEFKDPKDYFVGRFKFQSPLSDSDYETLKSDLSTSILFNNNGSNNRTGWIRKTTRNMATGEMNWELVTNLDSAR